MGLDKFVSILEQKSLFFTRITKLQDDDPDEGRMPPAAYDEIMRNPPSRVGQSTNSLASGADPEKSGVQDFVKRDIGEEAAECSVYFELVAEAHRRSLPPGQERDKESADWSRYSYEARQLSRSMIGEDRALASIKLGVDKIQRMTKNSLDNIMIAAAEYAYPCKDLMDDPRKRWNYWLEKELQLERQLIPKGGQVTR